MQRSLTLRPNGNEFLLEARQAFHAPLDKVFTFFSKAENLEQITPDILDFRILNTQPIAMKVGAEICYRIKIHGIPIRWKTNIDAWEPGVRFIDRQVSGPYRKWEHEHLFEVEGETTVVKDIVNYYPFGGRLIHSLFVKKDLEKIFSYRQEALAKIFTEV